MCSHTQRKWTSPANWASWKLWLWYKCIPFWVRIPSLQIRHSKVTFVLLNEYSYYQMLVLCSVARVGKRVIIKIIFSGFLSLCEVFLFLLSEILVLPVISCGYQEYDSLIQFLLFCFLQIFFPELVRLIQLQIH